MKEFEDLKSLLRDKGSLDMGILAGAFEHLSKEDRNYKLYILIFSSTQPPINLINSWHNKNFSFNLEQFDGFHIINLSRFVRNGQEITGSFGLTQFDKTGIWIAFTSDSSDFFNKGVVKFIESYRPDISRIYLSSGEIRGLFERIEETLSSRIYVRKAVLYTQPREGEISFKKRYFQDLFEDAESDFGLVDKVEYDIQEESGPYYHGFISRDLVCYYYSGRINRFFDFILPIIARIAKIKLNLFSNRERNSENAEAEPLCIDFLDNVFNDKKDNIKLISVLKEIIGGAVAVYHKNPYLHLSFLDFIDGSNFDIFVTESNKITIIPNYKCSAYSLMRVTDKIFKGFNEGNLKLAEKYTYSFADFVAE